MNRPACCMLLFALAAASASAQDLQLSRPPIAFERRAAVDDTIPLPVGGEVWGRYWLARVRGTMTITKGGVPGSGTRIDLHRDLGFDTESVVDFGARLSLGDHRISFSYLPLTFTRTHVLDKSVVYHNQTYSAGDSVHSELDYTLAFAGYDYRIGLGPIADVRLGGGAYYWRFDSRLHDLAAGGPNESRGFSSILPALTASLEVRPLPQLVFGTDLAAAATRLDHHIFNAEVFGGVRLADHFDLRLGYRALGIDMNATTNDGDMTVAGPYISINLRF